MTRNLTQDTASTAQILALIAGERAKALSFREWTHRLAGYGYGIKDTKAGRFVTSWPSGQTICELPTELGA